MSQEAKNLWALARAATEYPRGALTVHARGGDLLNRKVEVVLVEDDVEDAYGIIPGKTVKWAGPNETWLAAISEAINRDPFPGLIPDWQPGPHERAGTPWMDWDNPHRRGPTVGGEAAAS